MIIIDNAELQTAAEALRLQSAAVRSALILDESCDATMVLEEIADKLDEISRLALTGELGKPSQSGLRWPSVMVKVQGTVKTQGEVTWSPGAEPTRETLLAALRDIAGRFDDDDSHCSGHDPETCDAAICVARQALRGGAK